METIQEIFTILKSPRGREGDGDLCSCALVCSNWKQSAQREIWWTLTVSNNARGRILLESPILGRLPTRELLIWNDDEPSQFRTRADTVGKILAALKDLRILRISNLCEKVNTGDKLLLKDLEHPKLKNLEQLLLWNVDLAGHFKDGAPFDLTRLSLYEVQGDSSSFWLEGFGGGSRLTFFDIGSTQVNHAALTSLLEQGAPTLNTLHLYDSLSTEAPFSILLRLLPSIPHLRSLRLPYTDRRQLVDSLNACSANINRIALVLEEDDRSSDDDWIMALLSADFGRLSNFGELEVEGVLPRTVSSSKIWIHFVYEMYERNVLVTGIVGRGG